MSHKRKRNRFRSMIEGDVTILLDGRPMTTSGDVLRAYSRRQLEAEQRAHKRLWPTLRVVHVMMADPGRPYASSM